MRHQQMCVSESDPASHDTGPIEPAQSTIVAFFTIKKSRDDARLRRHRNVNARTRSLHSVA
jgi:hypothetical protein